MTEPTNATTSGDGDRYYEWTCDGETHRYPSVTTILATVVGKPFLSGWYARLAVEAEKAGEEDPSKAAERYRDFAADRGSRVHAAAEAHILGHDVAVLEDGDKPYYRAFFDWESDFGPEYESAEVTVYNQTRNYAGTVDIIARVPGLQGLGVIDIKTSKSTHNDHALQVAAYAHARTLRMPDDTALAAPEIKWAAILHLKPNGKYKFLPVADLDKSYEAFKAALAWYYALRAHTKVFSPALLPPEEPF